MAVQMREPLLLNQAEGMRMKCSTSTETQKIKFHGQKVIMLFIAKGAA